MNRGLRLGILVASGAAQALLFPPVSAWWLGPVVFALVLWALAGLSGGRALLAGWLMGASAVTALGYWIAPTAVHFAKLAWPVATLALLLYAVVFGAYAGVFAWGLPWLRRRTGAWWPFAVAAWWVACEFLNPQLFAHHLGLTLSAQPTLFLTTALTGVAGPSFLLVLAAGLLIAAVERALGGRPLVNRPALVALAVFAGAVTYGQVRGRHIAAARQAAPTRRLALVQDNLDVAARAALSRQSDTAIVDALVAQSRAALAADPRIEVLIWAESALEGSPVGPPAAALRALVRESGVELWTGGHAFSEDGERRYNAAFRVHGAGVVDPPYRKNILVPFGEYLPLSDHLPALQSLWRRPRNHAGNQQPVFTAPAGSFAFLICYEAVKSAYVRGYVSHAALDLLVNLTYDGWFGDTSCPHLHLAAAALQSAQLGLPMARVSSTGISAFVDAGGVVTARTPLFSPAVLVADVPRLAVPSPYRALGDWFAWACVAVSLGLLAAARKPVKP